MGYTPSRESKWGLRLGVLTAVLAVVVAACTDETADTTTTTPDASSTTVADSDTTTTSPDSEATTTTEAQSSEPQQGGEVVVGLQNESEGFLPGLVTLQPAGVQVAMTMFDPLVRRTRDGGIEPYLAESVESNEDFSAWTVALRPDVEFHDGTPLNAQAMKRIFDEFLTAENSRFLGDLAEVESLEILDDLTVRYNLSGPNVAFLDTLVDQPGWPFSPTAAAEAGEDAASNPVGTGPFKFVSWQRDGELIVERNENYWNEGLPYLDRITFRPIPDLEARFASLFAGDIDATHSQDLAALATAQQEAPDRNLTLEVQQGNNGDHVVFNTAQAPFDDVRVRQALTHASDQQAIIDVTLGGADIDIVPKTQYWSPDSPWYSEAVAEAYPEFDLDLAQTLLSDYINDPERSDGLAAGTPISLEIKIASVRPPDVAELLQALWGQIGVEVEITSLEASAWTTDYLAGEFDVVLSRQGNEDDPFTTFSVYYGDPETQRLNLTNWRSDELDALVAEIGDTTEFEERYPIVERIGLLLNVELPMFWSGPSNVAVVTAQPQVMNLKDWTFPDGTLGDGIPRGIVTWSHVWLSQ